MGRAERWIWSTGYYDPFWQAVFDLFNSIPLLGVAALLSFWRGRRWLLALFASMILHCFADLLLHHHDSHRHFFPFWDWRFESPVSYWDPRYYGHIFAPLELLLVLAGSLVLIATWRVQAVRLIAAGHPARLCTLYSLRNFRMGFWVLGSGWWGQNVWIVRFPGSLCAAAQSLPKMSALRPPRSRFRSCL